MSHRFDANVVEELSPEPTELMATQTLTEVIGDIHREIEQQTQPFEVTGVFVGLTLLGAAALAHMSVKASERFRKQ